MKRILLSPPDEHRRRRGRRRYVAAGMAALLPQSALLGGGGLRWLTQVGGAGSSTMTDQLFQALLTGMTGVGLPVVGVVCGVHFIRLGGNKLIGVSMVLAGPLVSALSLLAGVR